MKPPTKCRRLFLLLVLCLGAWWASHVLRDSHSTVHIQFAGFRNLEFGGNTFYEKADDGTATLTGHAYHCGCIPIPITRHADKGAVQPTLPQVPGRRP